MARPETLQDVIATLLETDPADVHPDFTFAGTRLQGSLARTRLYTAIEQQLGVACQAAYTARTYGELQAAIYGTAPLAPEQHVQHNGATPSIACGIDIQMVENLPVVRIIGVMRFTAPPLRLRRLPIVYCKTSRWSILQRAGAPRKRCKNVIPRTSMPTCVRWRCG